MPVIWATQVLETLVKRGLPSRAEVTDAAIQDGFSWGYNGGGPAHAIGPDQAARLSVRESKTQKPTKTYVGHSF